MKLRHDRPAWVDQRRCQLQREAERKASDDGMSCGIIPFGAVSHWQSIEEQRMAAALAAPLPARITGWDASGIGLVVTCPYCRAEHRHIVVLGELSVEDGWQPEEPLCSKGQYHIRITQENTNAAL